jgi:hypothetical protein
MLKKRKITLWFLIVITFMIAIYYFGWSFAPGSYARAEIYVINLPEQELIDIIKEIKVENQELTLPQQMQDVLKDGRLGREKIDFWYHIYFYYPNKNQIVNTWTRPKTKTSTSFAFVGINQGLTLGNWKDVNESIFWWKNRPMKNEFERRILSKIEMKINNESPTTNIWHLADSAKYKDISNK